MNIRMQLIRAGIAMAVIGGVGAATTLSPPSAPTPECPFAKSAKPQRIMLLDPVQKHPTWIDVPSHSSTGAIMPAVTITPERPTQVVATL